MTFERSCRASWYRECGLHLLSNFTRCWLRVYLVLCAHRCWRWCPFFFILQLLQWQVHQITTFKLKLIQRTRQSKETCTDYLLFGLIQHRRLWHLLWQDDGLLMIFLLPVQQYVQNDLVEERFKKNPSLPHPWYEKCHTDVYIYMYIFRCGPKGKLKVFEIQVSTNNGESLDQGAFAFEWTLRAYQKKCLNPSASVEALCLTSSCPFNTSHETM